MDSQNSNDSNNQENPIADNNKPETPSIINSQNNTEDNTTPPKKDFSDPIKPLSNDEISEQDKTPEPKLDESKPLASTTNEDIKPKATNGGFNYPKEAVSSDNSQPAQAQSNLGYTSTSSNMKPVVSEIEPTPSAEPVMLPSNNMPSQLSETDNGKQLVYTAWFSVSLGLLLGILSNAAWMIEIVFNHIGTKVSDTENAYASFLGFQNYELKTIAWLASSLLISTIAYILITKLILDGKQVTLGSFAKKVYGFVYGGFLTVVGIAAVASFTNLVYSMIAPLIPKGEYEEAGPWWVGILQALVTTLLLAAVFYFNIQMAKKSERLEQ